MNKISKLLLLMVAAGISLGIVTSAEAKNKTRYKYYDLGTLGGRISWSTGINNWGHVVGVSETSAPYQFRAFVWAYNGMKNLGVLEADFISGAWGINDRGQIVGFSLNSAFERRAVLWDRTGTRELGNLGGTFADAFALNRQGEIVGQSTLPGESEEVAHAVSWTKKRIKDINPFDSDLSVALSINSRGEMVGTYVTSEGLLRAVWWTKKGVNELGTLGGEQSEAYWINDKGDAVGWCELPDGAWHACLWTSHGDTVDLGVNDGLYSEAYSINRHGEVVGTYYFDDELEEARAFVWSRKDGLRDLSDLTIDLPAGVHVAHANSINDFGWIAGTSSNFTACLLIPVRVSCREGKGHEQGKRNG